MGKETEVKVLNKVTLDTNETITEERLNEIVGYISDVSGIELDTIYTNNLATSLLKLMPKRSHIICISVVKSNYASVRANVVEFENQDIVNYIIGHNHDDKGLCIGDIAHFGSNVVPLEVVYAKNTKDVEQIKKKITKNKQVIVDDNWFTSKEGAKAAITALDSGIKVADRYIKASDSVIMVKVMMYNLALVTGITPFTKIEDIDLYTKLR